MAEREDSDKRYLVKWEGLPYAECTWETEADVSGSLPSWSAGLSWWGLDAHAFYAPVQNVRCILACSIRVLPAATMTLY